MRKLLLSAPLLSLSMLMAGCDSAMIDSSLKPEVTGNGPREPSWPGKITDAVKAPEK